jgi:hypothetical protein
MPLVVAIGMPFGAARPGTAFIFYHLPEYFIRGAWFFQSVLPAFKLDTRARPAVTIVGSCKEESKMRMLLRVSIPVETGNAAAKAGTLGSTIEAILAPLKPEAVYFYADDHGQRAGSIVFDMQDTAQIPAIAEPWFLAFNAQVSIRPVMIPQDLAAAGPAIGDAVRKYGK